MWGRTKTARNELGSSCVYNEKRREASFSFLVRTLRIELQGIELQGLWTDYVLLPLPLPLLPLMLLVDAAAPSPPLLRIYRAAAVAPAAAASAIDIAVAGRRRPLVRCDAGPRRALTHQDRRRHRRRGTQQCRRRRPGGTAERALAAATTALSLSPAAGPHGATNVNAASRGCLTAPPCCRRSTSLNTSAPAADRRWTASTSDGRALRTSTGNPRNAERNPQRR